MYCRSTFVHCNAYIVYRFVHCLLLRTLSESDFVVSVVGNNKKSGFVDHVVLYIFMFRLALKVSVRKKDLERR